MDNKLAGEAPAVYPPIGSGATPSVPSAPYPTSYPPTQSPQQQPQQQSFPASGVPPPYSQYSEIPLNSSDARYYQHPPTNVQQPTYYSDVCLRCRGNMQKKKKNQMHFTHYFPHLLLHYIHHLLFDLVVTEMDRNASMRAASARSIYELETPVKGGPTNGLYVKPLPSSPNRGYGLPPSPSGNSESLKRSEIFTVQKNECDYESQPEQKVHPFTFFTTGRRLTGLVIICGLIILVLVAVGVALIAAFS